MRSELQLADFFMKTQICAHHQFYLSKLSVVRLVSGCDERQGGSIPLASHHWAIRLLKVVVLESSCVLPSSLWRSWTSVVSRSYRHFSTHTRSYVSAKLTHQNMQ
jgi:hypothetical protein